MLSSKICLFAMFAAVSLVGAGCTNDAPEFTEPPVVTIEEAGNVHQGVLGSFCYDTVCIDKIGPVELVAGSAIAYAAIDDPKVTIKVAASVSEITVGMLTEDGQTLKCDMQVERVSSTEYTAVLCDDPGRYIVDVSVRYTDGGDAAFYFPIIIDPGRE